MLECACWCYVPLGKTSPSLLTGLSNHSHRRWTGARNFGFVPPATSPRSPPAGKGTPPTAVGGVALDLVSQSLRPTRSRIGRLALECSQIAPSAAVHAVSSIAAFVAVAAGYVVGIADLVFGHAIAGNSMGQEHDLLVVAIGVWVSGEA